MTMSKPKKDNGMDEGAIELVQPGKTLKENREV